MLQLLSERQALSQISFALMERQQEGHGYLASLLTQLAELTAVVSDSNGSVSVEGLGIQKDAIALLSTEITDYIGLTTATSPHCSKTSMACANV